MRLFVEKRMCVSVMVDDGNIPYSVLRQQAVELADELPDSIWVEDGCGYQVFDENGEELK